MTVDFDQQRFELREVEPLSTVPERFSLGHWEFLRSDCKWSRVTQVTGQPGATYAAGLSQRLLCRGSEPSWEKARKRLVTIREQATIRLIKKGA